MLIPKGLERVWCSQKEELLALYSDGQVKRRRLVSAGRKPNDEEMEEMLFNWIMELRSRNIRVSCKMIRMEAKSRSSADTSTEEFKASLGWLNRFMKMYSFSLRRKTTVCQTVPSDCIPKLVSFILNLRTLRIRHQYSDSHIYAMDETPCWMDMPSETSVAPTGSLSVPIKSTGHEKDHFSVKAAKADINNIIMDTF